MKVKLIYYDYFNIMSKLEDIKLEWYDNYYLLPLANIKKIEIDLHKLTNVLHDNLLKFDTFENIQNFIDYIANNIYDELDLCFLSLKTTNKFCLLLDKRLEKNVKHNIFVMLNKVFKQNYIYLIENNNIKKIKIKIGAQNENI